MMATVLIMFAMKQQWSRSNSRKEVNLGEGYQRFSSIAEESVRQGYTELCRPSLLEDFQTWWHVSPSTDQAGEPTVLIYKTVRRRTRCQGSDRQVQAIAFHSLLGGR